jgi:hypothetical protein
MESDKASIRNELVELAERLDLTPTWPVISAAHRDLATIVGQVQGMVSTARREHGETAELRSAEEALDRLKTGVRKVGLDIRLASEPALAIGVQTSIDNALETLGWLEQIDA